MATFWERAAHSVDHMFSVFRLFVILVVSRFGVVVLKLDLGFDCFISWPLHTFFFSRDATQRNQTAH